jgi:hypothetical protein
VTVGSAAVPSLAGGVGINTHAETTDWLRERTERIAAAAERLGTIK